MENKQYLATYQYHDKNGNRLAVFGKENEGNLDIFIIKCSKSDPFYKKIARELGMTWINEGIEGFNAKYESEFHPITLSIPLYGKMHKVFFEYCKEHFYYLSSIVLDFEETKKIVRKTINHKNLTIQYLVNPKLDYQVKEI